MPPMLAGTKTIALVLLMMSLPLQAFSAMVMPHCQQDSAAVHDHAHPGGTQHNHDAPAHDHEHPPTSTDLASDHCGAGSVFAPPAPPFGCAGGPALPRDSFAAAHRFGFVPEQPQRPPLA